MLDWKKIVGDKLGSLPLDESKRGDIVEELAQQLEAAYQEELARGVPRAEAARRSLAQFQDWEKLRREIFQSASGAALPVWQQKGILSPGRPVVWIALVLSLAFLALPSFRKALHIAPLADWPDAWSSSAFSTKALQRIEKSGDTRKYARALAYVALHSPDEQQSAQAAERAMALDPQLTWICAKMSRANLPPPGYDSERWIKRLEAWAPDNAYVHLLAAGAAVNGDWVDRWSKYSGPELRRALYAESRWRLAMQHAFLARRWDIYAEREFSLNRQVLLENNLDRPDKLLSASWVLPLPNFGFMQMYADEAAEQELQAGHSERALAVYGQLAHLAPRLAAGSTDIERLVAANLATKSITQVSGILKSLRRKVDSDPAALSLAAIPAYEKRTERFGLRASSGYRAGQLAEISAATLLLFASVTVLWLVSVIVLRFRPGFSRLMNAVVCNISWAPLLLPVACLALFLSFFPYSNSIAGYSSPEAVSSALGAFFWGALSLRHNPLVDIWIHRMLWPALWCIVICAIGIRLLLWTRSRRQEHAAAE